jgi:lipopolysaccharide transport system ATP-binding protein
MTIPYSAINAVNLSKLYQIGNSQQRHDTLRDALTGLRFPVPRRSAVSVADRPPTQDLDLWALHDISFDIKQGEAVGIIGRNGAGKSTLLKLLSRITEPTSGRVEVRGRVASLLEVGTGFHPELTGRENTYLNGAILGMRKREIDRKFDEIVAFAEIERLLDTPVKRYSSGMYVRLAFSVAAHLEPEILLVDEVLAVGDASFHKKCLGKMGNVAKDGQTVLFVSHNMVAIQTLCQRVIWLDKGELKAQGEVGSTVADYLRSGLAENDTGERVWPDIERAPGNKMAKLRRVSVRPENGDPGDVITMQSPLRIEVEYWNLAPLEHLHPTLHVYDDQGVVAFSTGPRDFDPQLHIQPPAGLFRSVCHVPGNLFNSGFHRVSVLLERGSVANTFRFEEALGFEVVDNNERLFGWYNREPGVLHPRIPWSTEYLQSQAEMETVT